MSTGIVDLYRKWPWIVIVLAFLILICAWTILIVIAVRNQPESIKLENDKPLPPAGEVQENDVEPNDINTLTGAFIAGLITSIHCMGMCGPIACSVAAMRGSESERQTAAVLYHTGRVFSYTTLGAIAGGIGFFPLHSAVAKPLLVLPWVMVAVFLIMAFGLEKQLPRPGFINRQVARIRLRAGGLSLRKGGLAIGLLTPLLPCGPLYLILGIALVSASPLRGAEFMLTFALGTLPLLWIAQHNVQRLGARMTPASRATLRRTIAFGAAALMTWRMWPTLAESDFATSCPLCP